VKLQLQTHKIMLRNRQSEGRHHRGLRCSLHGNEHKRNGGNHPLKRALAAKSTAAGS
jgi:hypothetical protein